MKYIAVEDDTPEVVEDGLQDPMVEFEQGSAELSTGADRVDETAGLINNIDAQADSLEAAAETGEVSEDLVIATEMFMQHATRRLGTKMVTFGMESGDSKETTKQKALRVATEMRKLNDRAEKCLDVAIEDFGNKAKKFSETLEKTSDSLLGKLHAAVAESDKKPGKGGKTIEDLSWAKNLGCKANPAKYSDVHNAVVNIGNQVKSVDKDATSLADLVKLATGEMRATWFWSSEHNVKKLASISEEINSIASKIEDSIVTAGKADSVVALSDKEARDLAKQTEGLLSGAKSGDAVGAVFSSANWNTFWGWVNHGWRIKSWILASVTGGLSLTAGTAASIVPGNHKHVKKAREVILADDVAAARNAAEDARAAAHNLIKVSEARVRLGNAIVNYINISSHNR